MCACVVCVHACVFCLLAYSDHFISLFGLIWSYIFVLESRNFVLIILGAECFQFIVVGGVVEVKILTGFLCMVQWLCLESLLSLPGYAVKNGVQLEGHNSFLSDAALRQIFIDLVEK